jgi:hypothetical protein
MEVIGGNFSTVLPDPVCLLSDDYATCRYAASHMCRLCDWRLSHNPQYGKTGWTDELPCSALFRPLFRRPIPRRMDDPQHHKGGIVWGRVVQLVGDDIGKP